MQKIEINKKILIFSIQDRDLFTTLLRSVATRRQLTDAAARRLTVSICFWLERVMIRFSLE